MPSPTSPPRLDMSANQTPAAPPAAQTSPPKKHPTRARYRLDWATLLKRTFAFDVLQSDSTCDDRSQTGIGINPGDGPDSLVYLLGGGAAASPRDRILAS